MNWEAIGALGELAGATVKDLPGMNRYWSQRRGFFHSEFADYVDDLLLQDSIETLGMYKRPNNGLDQ